MSAITSRYARAFADVVFEQNPGKIAEELISLHSLIASSSALRLALPARSRRSATRP